MTNHISFKKRAFLPLVCAVAAGLVFSGCMDFFATSWGEDAQRDPSAMTIDASNVFKVLKNARGNPAMSLTILDKIAEEIGSASPGDKQKLREAALVAAAQATDVAGHVVSNIDTITDAMNSGNGDPAALLNSIIGGVDKNATAKASADLVKILPPVDAYGKFTEDFHATDAELTQTAFILIMGESGGNVDEYLQHWGTDKNLNSEANLSGNELALAGIMNKLIGQSSSPLATGLKGVMTPSS
jgi:hypothetical protein